MTIGKESLLETARETAPGRISQAVASEASVASTARIASAGGHSLPCGSPEGAGTALGGGTSECETITPRSHARENSGWCHAGGAQKAGYFCVCDDASVTLIYMIYI